MDQLSTSHYNDSVVMVVSQFEFIAILTLIGICAFGYLHLRKTKTKDRIELFIVSATKGEPIAASQAVFPPKMAVEDNQHLIAFKEFCSLIVKHQDKVTPSAFLSALFHRSDSAFNVC